MKTSDSSTIANDLNAHLYYAEHGSEPCFACGARPCKVVRVDDVNSLMRSYYMLCYACDAEAHEKYSHSKFGIKLRTPGPQLDGHEMPVLPEGSS